MDSGDSEDCDTVELEDCERDYCWEEPEESEHPEVLWPHPLVCEMVYPNVVTLSSQVESNFDVWSSPGPKMDQARCITIDSARFPAP